MIYRILADLTVLLHLSFIVFALLGGISVLWYRYAAVLHLPAGIWVVLISFKGWICPLTPLENHWRQAAGLEGYEGGFVEHYVLPVIYPMGLTPSLQVTLGFIALAINVAIYVIVIVRLGKSADR